VNPKLMLDLGASQHHPLIFLVPVEETETIIFCLFFRENVKISLGWILTLPLE